MQPLEPEETLPAKIPVVTTEKLESALLLRLYDKPIYGDPLKAAAYMRSLAATSQNLSRVTLRIVVEIGRQLLALESSGLWSAIERRDYRHPDVPEGIPCWESEDSRCYLSWADFMREGFENLTGYGRARGYWFMKLARSTFIRNEIDSGTIQNWANIQNAQTIVQLESQGMKITPELIAEGRTAKADGFKSKHLGVAISIRARSVIGSDDVRFLIGFLGRLDDSDRQLLRTMIEDGENRWGYRAGGSLVEIWHAAQSEQFREFEAVEPWRQDPVQTEEDFRNGHA